MNKYHAKKTFYRGVEYDSKHEAQVAYELDMLERAGKIQHLERQKRFILQDGYINNKGEKIRPISYIADMYYYDVKKKIWVVVDCKGSKVTLTPEYRIKKKLFEARYKDILFVEIYKRK